MNIQEQQLGLNLELEVLDITEGEANGTKTLAETAVSFHQPLAGMRKLFAHT